ncbi:ParB N-terminal domain-containing protein [Rhodobacter sp. HX-7-19]|uniref:site-specific DNA-methyltransferase (adenine-specific) n=1 Tax=Paragemmobacter kunshanensis TaxID=2583234 RepID=A0A6M1U348_9RHOB|nr:DNA methyltransferase [Rhodobacter kunshanensis]NGQ93152.1 ParB N-terminal domain-containing protein [Rhodobacter kunshanensis]
MTTTTDPACGTGQSLPVDRKQAVDAGVIRHLPLAALKPYVRNARRHDDKQVELITRSIREYGFVNPVLIDKDNVIVAGHGRYEAAMRLGLATVPTIRIEHLTEAQIRAYRIADNRIAELSEWDADLLRLEIVDLSELEFKGELDFDLSLTGFNTPELDIILEGEAAGTEETERVDLPGEETPAVTRPGDLWVLGEHRLLCGDALLGTSYARLMEGELARMVFTDPPFNVQVAGHVRTKAAHREFAMASGEMSDSEFRNFLAGFLRRCKSVLMEGGMAFGAIDWRHVEDLIFAGKSEDLSLINLCVWNKTNGGMGSLYRSKHELVCVFKKEGARHVNNVELGRHGRYRTNVWDYPGVNTFRRGRAADLADHPTVKPTALVADAIRDVSHRGEIVLDPFGGSGSTLLAADKTRRRARLIEIDPLYCDVAVRRWQALTGGSAVLAETGERFDTRAAALETEADHGQATQ